MNAAAELVLYTVSNNNNNLLSGSHRKSHI
jgi:hypothetical protein